MIQGYSSTRICIYYDTPLNMSCHYCARCFWNRHNECDVCGNCWENQGNRYTPGYRNTSKRYTQYLSPWIYHSLYWRVTPRNCIMRYCNSTHNLFWTHWGPSEYDWENLSLFFCCFCVNLLWILSCISSLQNGSCRCAEKLDMNYILHHPMINIICSWRYNIFLRQSMAPLVIRSTQESSIFFTAGLILFWFLFVTLINASIYSLNRIYSFRRWTWGCRIAFVRSWIKYSVQCNIALTLSLCCSSIFERNGP